MKKISLALVGSFLALTLGVCVGVSFDSKHADVEEAHGYSSASVPTTINLNDLTDSEIRSYYSSLNSLGTAQRQGTNLLKNLKTILKSGQQYYAYDSSSAHWQLYEIMDRDWDRSPASSISGYNSSTGIITGYTYGTSTSDKGTNPYLHALYFNRNVTNEVRAWDSHGKRTNPLTIEREHIWPKSQGFDEEAKGGARGDPFELQSANGTANGLHSNLMYGYVNKSVSYTDAGSTHSIVSGNLSGKSLNIGTNTVFEPQDSDKGDIARAIFYMVARYNYLSGSDSDGIDSNNPNLELVQNDSSLSGYESSTSSTGKLGILTDLLAWHHADPVDQFEIHRNNLIYRNFSHNRNPFIDFPEWVDFIWGTATYNGRLLDSYDSEPTSYATPSSDTINGYNSGSGETISVTGVSLNVGTLSVEEGKSGTLVETVTPSNATNQSVTWTSSDSTIATVSNGLVHGVSEGSATITVRTNDGGYTATCTVTVTPSSGGDSGEGTEEGSVTAASGALSGWTASGTASAYADGSVKFDSSGDNVYKTDIFTNEVASNMTSITVTINGKINGTPTAANSYKVEALDSSGNVLGSDVQTGASVVTSSYGDTTFTIDSGLSGCTGLRITYVTKGAGNWGIKSVSWTATYSTETEVTVSSIAVKTAPTKLTYTAGDGFAPAGLVLEATYSDSSKADIPYENNEDQFEFDPSDNLQTSDVSVTITWSGKTCTQAITVNAAKTLSSITLNTDNVTKSFYVDDTFEHDNLVVTAHYSDSSDDVVSSSATVSVPDMSTAGDKTITVSYTYGGTTQNASYTITVLESGGAQTGSYTWDLSIASYNTPTSAALVTWSSQCATMTAEQATGKTAANNYLGGDSNARTSSRFYSGNTTRFVPSSSYEITSVVFTATSNSYANALRDSTWTNATAVVSNSTTVTITPTDGTSEFYAVIGVNCGFTSCVVNYNYTPTQVLTSITVDTTNVQTTFAVGDTFNYTGLVVTAHYNSGADATVTPTSVSTPDLSTTGSKDVTVSYTEGETTKSATYSITVNVQPTLSWTAPTINTYSGTSLTSTESNTWAVKYNNGSGTITDLTYGDFTVKLNGTTISLPYTWQPGDDEKTLAVSYSGLTTEATTVSIVQSLQAINTEVPGQSYTSDLTFTAACGGSGTADDGKSWTVTSDASESTFVSNKGIHYGTGKAAVQYIVLSSTAFTSGKITSVVVNASTASGVTGATVAVSVGGSGFGGTAQSINTTATDYTFNGNADADRIEVQITKPSSAANALYCLSVKVTYSTSSTLQNIANVAGHENAQRAVVKFAKAFNSALGATENCTTGLSSAWSTASSAWSTFLSEASALGETEEAYAKSLIANATAQWTEGTDSDYSYCLERCLATYEKCVTKHGQTDFMSDVRTLSSAPIVLPIALTNFSNSTLIIVLISVLGLSAVGGYFYIRRKKEC